MHKLPVFETFGNAIAFPFREFSAVVRLSWLPMLILLVATFFFLQEYVAVMPKLMESIGSNRPPEIPPAFFALEFGYVIVTVVITAVVAAALYRVVLFGERRPGTFVYFSFGKVELLLAIMPFVLGLIMILFVLVFAAVIGFLAGLLAASEATPAAGVIPAIVGLLFVGFLIWFAVRMMLWAPTIVAEQRFALVTAAKLTAGNVWRLIGLVLLTIGALLILEIILLAVIGQMFATHMPMVMPGPDATPEERVRAVGEMMSAFVAMIRANIIPLGIGWYLFAIVFNAVGVGLLGYAYKAIKGVPADRAIVQ